MIYIISGSLFLIVLDCIYDIIGMFVLVGGENFIVYLEGLKFWWSWICMFVKLNSEFFFDIFILVIIFF